MVEQRMGEKSWVKQVKTLVKMSPSKAVVVRLNLVLFALSFVIYTMLLLRPSSSAYFENAASLVRCSLHDCHHKVGRGVKMQELTEENNQIKAKDRVMIKRTNLTKLEVPSFMDDVLSCGGGFGRTKIGMVNVDEWDVSEWERYGETIPIRFERVSELFKWEDLFPEWIDEEEETDVATCPEIPMPELGGIEKVDVVVVGVPCKYPEEGWRREVERLQAQLVAAEVAAKKGKRDWQWRTKVVIWSKCRPLMEIFRCDDMVKREGEWWFYQPEVMRLLQKLDLPVGSCKLALPLWGQGVDEVYDLSKLEAATRTPRREAYATVLHSSEAYVCGAITLAQSLRQSGTKRDLVLLHDDSISRPKLQALASAGWQLRLIRRIRNPHAEKHTYNEYNYSKFRLWQLTQYDKVIFIDADIIVLRNLDILFHFPQMSASGNDIWLFNSGIMVIEPSNCTFRTIMRLRKEIVSYNGGDQGFLNEVFVWWHRFPRRINYLKNFSPNMTSNEINLKNYLFLSDPPKLYTIHYLGWKPWRCYRDYDCNYDVAEQFWFASDTAHARWWKLHDSMDEELQRFCRLTEKRRTELNWERRRARLKNSTDHHWRINVTDPRRRRSFLID